MLNLEHGNNSDIGLDDQKTVSFYSASPIYNDKDPVTGWLICVKGLNFGRDYRLKKGRNFIGRADSMDVAINGENTVSRERHAIIIYEPKQNIFLVQPGDSRELTYLNGQLVLNPTVLKKNDILELGETSLMFIPFCDETFRWDEN